MSLMSSSTTSSMRSTAEEIVACRVGDLVDSIGLELSLPRVERFEDSRVCMALRTIASLAKGSSGDIPGATAREVRAVAASRPGLGGALVEILSPHSALFAIATREAALHVVEALVMADVDVIDDKNNWRPCRLTTRQRSLGAVPGLLEALVDWLQGLVAPKEEVESDDKKERLEAETRAPRAGPLWRRRAGVSSTEGSSRQQGDEERMVASLSEAQRAAVWKPGELELVKLLCQSLRGLCCSVENSRKLGREAGAVAPLLSVLRLAPPDCAQSAAGVLIPLSMWHPQLIVLHRGVEFVCRHVLQSTTETMSWLCAATILSHLCVHDETSRAVAMERKALNQLVHLAARGTGGHKYTQKKHDRKKKKKKLPQGDEDRRNSLIINSGHFNARIQQKTRVAALWALARLSRTIEVREAILEADKESSLLRESILNALEEPATTTTKEHEEFDRRASRESAREAALILLFHLCRKHSEEQDEEDDSDEEKEDDWEESTEVRDFRRGSEGLLRSAAGLVAACFSSSLEPECTRAAAADCLTLYSTDEMRIAVAYGPQKRRKLLSTDGDYFRTVAKPPPEWTPLKDHRGLVFHSTIEKVLHKNHFDRPRSSGMLKGILNKKNGFLPDPTAAARKAVAHLPTEKLIVYDPAQAGKPAVARDLRYDPVGGILAWESYEEASGETRKVAADYKAAREQCKQRAVQEAEILRNEDFEEEQSTELYLEEMVIRLTAEYCAVLPKPPAVAEDQWVELELATSVVATRECTLADIDFDHPDLMRCFVYQLADHTEFVFAIPPTPVLSNGDASDEEESDRAMMKKLRAMRKKWLELPRKLRVASGKIARKLKKPTGSKMMSRRRSSSTAFHREIDDDANPFNFDEAVKAAETPTLAHGHADLLGELFKHTLTSKKSSAFIFRASRVALNLVCNLQLNKDVRARFRPEVAQLAATLRDFAVENASSLKIKRHEAILTMKIELLVLLDEINSLETKLSELPKLFIPMAKGVILHWRKLLGYTTLSSATDGLDPEALKKLQRLFADLDDNASGYVMPHELRLLFKKLQIPVTKSGLEQIVDEVDVDGNGMIDFEEFVLVVRNLEDPRRVQARLGVAIAKGSAMGHLKDVALGKLARAGRTLKPVVNTTTRKKLNAALQVTRAEHDLTHEASMEKEASLAMHEVSKYRRDNAVSDWQALVRRVYSDLASSNGGPSFYEVLEAVAANKDLLVDLGFVRRKKKHVEKPEEEEEEVDSEAEFQAAINAGSYKNLQHVAVVVLAGGPNDPNVQGWAIAAVEVALWKCAKAFRKIAEAKVKQRRERQLQGLRKQSVSKRNTITDSLRKKTLSILPGHTAKSRDSNSNSGSSKSSGSKEYKSLLDSSSRGGVSLKSPLTLRREFDNDSTRSR